MKLSEKIEKLNKRSFLGIWKRTSSPVTVRSARKTILAYLDETTKSEFKPAHDPSRSSIWLQAGVNYLTKEQEGTLKVYGFLQKDIVQQTGRYPIHLSNSERVHAAADAWMLRLRKKNIKRTAHKYVLALPPEMCEIMAEMGKSADEALTQMARTVMRRYQEKFYPSQQIGYLLGIHHDRRHIHAHLMLFPTTENGKLLRITDEGPTRGSRRPFTFMRKQAQKEVQRYFDRELLRPAIAARRGVEDVFQPRMLVRYAQQLYTELPEEEKIKKNGWEWVAEKRREWDRMNGRDFGPILEEAYNFAEHVYEKTSEHLDRAGIFAGKIKDGISSTQEELNRLYTELRDIAVEQRELMRKRQEHFLDLSNWSHYRFGRSGFANGTAGPRDRDVEKWLIDRMSKTDSVAALMREKVTEDQRRLTQNEANARFLRAPAETAYRSNRAQSRRDERDLAQGVKEFNRQATNPTMTQDFAREYLRGQIRVNQEETDALILRRKDLLDKLQQTRLRLQARELELCIVNGALRKEQPRFLAQRAGWKALGLPIQISPAVRGISSLETPDYTEHTTSPSLAERITESLRRLRESRMDDTLFSVEGHYGPVPSVQEEPHGEIQAKLIDDSPAAPQEIIHEGQPNEEPERIDAAPQPLRENLADPSELSPDR